MRSEGRERAHGPYPHGKKWRVILVAANGARRYRPFASEHAAREYIEEWNNEMDRRTIGDAVRSYCDRLRSIGRAAGTVTTTEHRLTGLLQLAKRDRSLRSLTPGVAAKLFEQRSASTSVDTQVGELSAAHGFVEWCVDQGWLRRDPFDGLEPVGSRTRGKEQLRIDEARRYVDAALAEATAPAIAATMPVLCGMRASEITDRVVRDVDDGVRVLWIERAKTRAGDRRIGIPAVLQPFIGELVNGRSGGEPLWGDVDRHWLGYHVRRICRMAGVPVVCPHGLRGTWASLSVAEMPVDHVARALGHESAAITRRHYLANGAEQAGQQQAALRVLAGGRP